MKEKNETRQKKRQKMLALQVMSQRSDILWRLFCLLSRFFCDTPRLESTCVWILVRALRLLLQSVSVSAL